MHSVASDHDNGEHGPVCVIIIRSKIKSNRETDVLLFVCLNIGDARELRQLVWKVGQTCRRSELGRRKIKDDWISNMKTKRSGGERGHVTEDGPECDGDRFSWIGRLAIGI